MSRRVSVILQDTPPNRSAPTFTGRAFLASIPERGVFNAAKVYRSAAAVLSASGFGFRQSYSVFADWVEHYFREGGAELVISPVRGPAPVIATLNLAGTGTTLVVNAKSAGEWGNGAAGGLTAEVITGASGGAFRVIIIRYNGVEVERTPEYDTRQPFVDWSAASDYVNIVLGGGSGQPTVVGATNLTGGTLDRTNITQTQIDAALDLFATDLGPGQLCAPDWQTDANYNSLKSKAKARNRHALLDAVDTTAKATLLTAVNLVQGDTDGTHGSFLAPWLTISGTAGGAIRSVPPSAFIAAKCAQTDLAAGANQAPAGEYGRATSSLTLDVKATFSDTDQAELETSGVNVLINRLGGVENDGNRSLVEPLGVDSEWLQMSNARFRMDLVAGTSAIAETFRHKIITPVEIAKFDSALTGYLLTKQNQLYPADDGSDPGFVVDTQTGPGGVNPPEDIEAGKLQAAIGYRPAKGADLVIIYLTTVGIADPVA